jgi:uncharacterized protein with NRDE domain
MCLIVFAWRLLPDTPLVLAANRDEFYERPTAPAAWWDKAAGSATAIYAGRDLQAGGTWMGIAAAVSANSANPPGPASRFAAITNIRAPSEKKSTAPSRGQLVSDYLASNLSPADYLEAIRANARQYNGFNLLLGNQHELIWFSNRAQDDVRNGQPLVPGIYGVSNAVLDTAWPKLIKAKAEFSSLLCQRAPDDAYFEMLGDTTKAPDERLPDTGVSLEWERLLSPICIVSPNYGTRCSSLLRIHAQQAADFQERTLR